MDFITSEEWINEQNEISARLNGNFVVAVEL